MRFVWIWALLLFVPGSVVAEEESRSVRLSEIVADPLGDWNEDGKFTPSDEYVELENLGDVPVSLEGWSLWLNDTTPVRVTLNGTIPARGWWVLLNPTGEINTNAHVALQDPSGRTVDEVRYGTWPGATGTPSALAKNETDEALARAPAWMRNHATPGFSNLEPRWATSYEWPAPSNPGWIGPNRTLVAHARAIETRAAAAELSLWHTDVLDANTLVGALASGESRLVAVIPGNGTLAWQTAATSHRSPPTPVWVDDSAPLLPTLPPRRWLNTSVDGWDPPSAVEDGVGSVMWQARAADSGEVGPWSPTLGFNASSWVDGEQRGYELRVRDALHNTSPWSPSVTIGMDRVAPSGSNVTVRPQRVGFEIEWEPAVDNGSGVATYRVDRILAASSTSWLLSPNETRLLDAVDAQRSSLEYRVQALDEARNAGPVASVVVDHAGLHPQVKDIRISRPFWSTGVQEIRVDFDRSMNTTVAPQVSIDGNQTLPAGSRWFANRTTFAITLSNATSRADGVHPIRVSGAIATDGQGMLGPALDAFVVDHTKPLVRTDVAEGWTNASQVSVTAEDANLRGVGWRLWSEGDAEPTDWTLSDLPDVTVPLVAGNWSLRVAAQDLAGNSASLKVSYRVDLQAPTFGEANASFNPATLAVDDSASGVNWTSVRATAPAGWTVRSDPGRRLIVVSAGDGAIDGNMEITVADRAGNAAAWSGALVAPVRPREASPSSSAGARLDATLTEAAQEPEGRGAASWWMVPLMGAVALGVPMVKKSRRKRPAAATSFAARLRDLRAAQGTG